MKKMILSVFVTFLMLNNAQAAFHIEPKIGLTTNSLDLTRISSATADQGGKASGIGLGLNAGYKLPLFFWFGAEYNVLSGATYKSNNSLYSGKFDSNRVFLMAGVDFPLFLRAWLGYGIVAKDKLTFDNSSVNSLTLEDGSAIKLGVGLSMIPFLSVNFEYFIQDYDKYSEGSNSGSASSLFSTHKNSGISIGVSAPFNL